MPTSGKSRLIPCIAALLMRVTAQSTVPGTRQHWHTPGRRETETWTVAWVFKKLKHMVDITAKVTVFTDHSAVTAVINKTYIATTTATYAVTSHLRAVLYLVSPKVLLPPGIPNDIADNFNHAVNIFDRDSTLDSPIGNSLDAVVVPTFHTLQVEISDDFKGGLGNGYEGDKVWRRILRACCKKAQPSEKSPVSRASW